MNLLLDTCALLALAGQAGKLPRKAANALSSANAAHVSTVSAWEIAIKAKAGKIHMSGSVDDWFRTALHHYHLQEIPLASGLLCAASDLPLLHRDPFDRVLVATALAHKLTILTSDRIIPTYPGIKDVW